MVRLNRSVEMIVVLFVAGMALSVSGADNESATAGKASIPKLMQKAADEPAAEGVEEAANEAADPFAVPDGTPKELVEYIAHLISSPPRGADSMKKMRKAILQAAERILAAKPNEEEMEFAVEAKMNMLEGAEQLADFAAELKKDGKEELARQVQGFIIQLDLGKAAMSDPKQTKKSIEEAIKFLEASPPQTSDIRLAFMVGRLSEMAHDKELAVNTYASLAKTFAASKDPRLADFTNLLEGVGRRLNLVGQELKIEGKVLGNGQFDWSKHQGKVVLVDFWATGYPASMRDIPQRKALYKLYHDRGFDIVGVSLDRDVPALEAIVREEDIPWTIVTGDGKPSPSVIYYGVVSLPTTILAGKDGKVIALNLNAESLRAELDKLLGPVDEKPIQEDAKQP